MPSDASEGLGVECDVHGCDERLVGLEDGWEFSRGPVCAGCIDYLDEHGHWPDDDMTQTSQEAETA